VFSGTFGCVFVSFLVLFAVVSLFCVIWYVRFSVVLWFLFFFRFAPPNPHLGILSVCVLLLVFCTFLGFVLFYLYHFFFFCIKF